MRESSSSSAAAMHPRLIPDSDEMSSNSSFRRFRVRLSGMVHTYSKFAFGSISDSQMKLADVSVQYCTVVYCTVVYCTVQVHQEYLVHTVCYRTCAEMLIASIATWRRGLTRHRHALGLFFFLFAFFIDFSLVLAAFFHAVWSSSGGP